MKKNDFYVQVKRDHYYNEYDSFDRFITYFYQVDITKSLNPETVLEIGVGNKTVSNYLKQHGYNITTCDFDKELQPDCVADIRNLPFDNNSYDLVLAFEILEHLPWDDVNIALSELHRVTNKHAVISIPYFSAAFEIAIHFPFIKKILKKPFLNIFLFRIPLFFRGIQFTGEHYWEMGRKNYSIWKVRKLFKKRFLINKEVRPTLNSDHHFFVLEKTSAAKI